MTVFRKTMMGFLLAAVFAGLLAQGLRMSLRKPLWGDETYSYSYSIVPLSFADIWNGRIKEGNNSPLFYSLEKLVVRATGTEDLALLWWRARVPGTTSFGFLMPSFWRDVCEHPDLSARRDLPARTRLVSTIFQRIYGKVWRLKGFDPGAAVQIRGELIQQVVLRLVALLFTAAGVTGIVWYFARFYSLSAAVFALLAVLASENFWPFWTDARPYAMVTCFSLLQAITILHIFRRGPKRICLAALMMVDVLLSLTTAVAALQIAAVAVLFLFMRYRDVRGWGGAVLGPLVLIGWYQAQAPHYPFFLRYPMYIATLFNMNCPWYWGGALLIASGVLLFQKRRDSLFCFLGWGWMVAGLYLLLTVWLSLRQTTHQFEIVGRYFLVLMPVGVVALTALFAQTLRQSRNAMEKILVIAAGAFLLFPGLSRAWGWLIQGTWPNYLRI